MDLMLFECRLEFCGSWFFCLLLRRFSRENVVKSLITRAVQIGNSYEIMECSDLREIDRFHLPFFVEMESSYEVVVGVLFQKFVRAQSE